MFIIEKGEMRVYTKKLTWGSLYLSNPFLPISFFPLMAATRSVPIDSDS